MIRHHPSDTTLLACAAGTLPAPHASIVAVHAAQCPVCRDVLRLGTEVGGVLMQELPPAPVSGDALARAMARLEDVEADEPQPATTLAALARGRWRWVAPGIHLMPLARRDASDTRLDLIRVTPGTALPQHGHTGQEMTCVLRGAFADTTGEYHAGDVAETDVELDHQPVALLGEECVCLIATTGRLRAHGMLAQLLQRLIGV